MLTVTALTKAFGARRVIDHLDLEVGAGECVAMLGANGSGKTTLLRCVAGLARPTAGSIRIGGVDLAIDAVGARRRLSYLPQKSAFPATLTVRETLAVVARIRGAAPAAVEREIESCGLAPLADCGIGHLSGGEGQRLAMAVAFLPSVDLYVFDEPSASLDPIASRILFQRVRQLKRDRRAILFTTHVPADVRHLATRIVVLRNGRIESDGAGQFELRRYERMLELDMRGSEDDDAIGDSWSHAGGGINAGVCDAHPVAGAPAARSR